MPKNGHTILKTKLNEYFVDGFECYQTSDKKDFFTSKYDAITYFLNMVMAWFIFSMSVT